MRLVDWLIDFDGVPTRHTKDFENGTWYLLA